MKEPHIPLDNVAVVVLDVSGQTEVTDLCHTMVRQQDVPRRNVSVDALTNGTFPSYNPLWMNIYIRQGLLLRFWLTGSLDLEPPGRKSS